MRTRSSQGFSLPEVLIAVAVFGIASVALAATLVLNIRSNRASNDISEATTLAQSYVEYLRGQSIAASASTCPSTGAPTVSSPYSLSSADCVLGSAPATINGVQVPGLRTVAVTVRWRESAESTQRSVTLQSYLTY